MKSILTVIFFITGLSLCCVSYGQISPQVRQGSQPAVHTIQSTAPSLDNLQVIEVSTGTPTGPQIHSQTAQDLSGQAQTAPSGGGNGPQDVKRSTEAVLPNSGVNLNPPVNPDPNNR